MAQTVLVTGGSGFIGGWCVKLLLEKGYEVRTTLRSLSGEAAVRKAVGAEGDTHLAFFAADLTDDKGWAEAMAGCDLVLHVASPLSSAADGDFITPARDGTVRVLKAAVEAGVKRVVMTSAAATARAARGSGIVSDETVWADPADPQWDPYRQSKILAEKAAWEFMATTDGRTEFTTVLPGAVFGPILSASSLGSVRIVENILKGQPGMVPRLGFWVVDVRDLADLHIKAMVAPEAAGERFLGIGEHMWMLDIAKALKANLGEAAKNTPTKQMPDTVFRLAAAANPQLRLFAQDLGKINATNPEKARRVLGFAPRSGAETVTDCARSLLALEGA